MNRAKLFVILSFGISCASCSGTLFTGNTIPFENGRMKGVVFYPPALFKETSETRIATKDGKVIGDANDPQHLCQPIRTVKIISAPDYSQPRRMWYEHGLLETFTFAATLDASGDLLSVNTQSTPDQGKTFQNVASGVASLASAAGPAMAAAPGIPACTDGSITMARERYIAN